MCIGAVAVIGIQIRLNLIPSTLSAALNACCCGLLGGGDAEAAVAVHPGRFGDKGVFSVWVGMSDNVAS